MKKVILAAITISMLLSCNNSTKSQTKTMASTEVAEMKSVLFPKMTFTELNHDFGIIKEGDIVEHQFSFTNTGEVPLVISNAKGSCGCTVPKWPKEPIQPGATETLLVSFNSNGKPNLQTKKITITANTESGKETLSIKAMVTPKKKISSLNNSAQ
ncbi:DUF1573 domain-containing protein [Aquimarina pacifica]|uniref:DUF1573 domain-containing protein n=1 Tax=Aquimarina pacifica TaxID=1296415 RepID=UPI00046E79DA|nr:DUF1573 domain-containing protein [Aquimarina pacifica]